MKHNDAVKRFFSALLSAAAYYGAFRLIQWFLGEAAVSVLRATGWLNQVPLTALNYAVTLCIHAVTFGLLYLWMWLRHRSLAAEVGCRPLDVVPMAAALLGGIGANLTVSWLFELIPIPETWMQNYSQSSETVFVDYSWMTVVMTVIVAPLTEELLYRGLIYTRLRRGMPCVLAAVLSAATFGAAHGDLLWAMYAFAVGLLFAWIFEKTGSLWGTVLCHMGFNAFGQFSLQGWSGVERGIAYVLGVVLLGAAVIVILWHSKQED